MPNASNLLYTMLVVVFLVSCQENHRNNTQKTESGIRLVGRYEVVESKMKYIVYREVDGGFVYYKHHKRQFRNCGLSSAVSSWTD